MWQVNSLPLLKQKVITFYAKQIKEKLFLHL